MTTISLDFDVTQLEGWLNKKKSNKGFLEKLAGKDSNKRFFKIKAVKGSQFQELTLLYSDSPKDIDEKPHGWFYLRDIKEIIEEDSENTFTLVTNVKSLTLEAPTTAQCKLWLQGFVHLCTTAVLTNVKSAVRKADPKVTANKVVNSVNAYAKLSDDRPIDGRSGSTVDAADAIPSHLKTNSNSSQQQQQQQVDDGTIENNRERERDKDRERERYNNNNNNNKDASSVSSGSGSSTENMRSSREGVSSTGERSKEDHRKNRYVVN
jgi:hypothetical protein